MIRFSPDRTYDAYPPFGHNYKSYTIVQTIQIGMSSKETKQRRNYHLHLASGTETNFNNVIERIAAF
jgi:hypothetical protein